MKPQGVYMEVDEVEVLTEGIFDLTEEEAAHYVAITREQKNTPLDLAKIVVRPAKKGGEVEIEFQTENVRFERIRRITGYLVGTIDRWNNAKKSEERERVKHA